jgi:hypothetical protein
VVRPTMRLLEDAENDLRELKIRKLKKKANDIEKRVCHE